MYLNLEGKEVFSTSAAPVQTPIYASSDPGHAVVNHFSCREIILRRTLNVYKDLEFGGGPLSRSVLSRSNQTSGGAQMCEQG